MALFPIPKLAATLVALLLITTIASSFGEVKLRAKIIVEDEFIPEKHEVVIEDGKVLVVQPKSEVVMPHIEAVTHRQALKCSQLNEYCNSVLINACCEPFVCKEYPLVGGICGWN